MSTGVFGALKSPAAAQVKMLTLVPGAGAQGKIGNPRHTLKGQSVLFPAQWMLTEGILERFLYV